MSFKDTLQDAIKTAMRSKDKLRLITLRMFSAAIKQQEVDTRQEPTDEDCLKILTTMIKQRKEAHKQFAEAGRDDLANKETAELAILHEFLPTQLSETELEQMVDNAISATSAKTVKDMGKVMAELKPAIQGKADPAKVSALIKTKLQASS